MVDAATRVPKATPCLATLAPTAQATALGYPATLRGYTPDQIKYWRESGLPFLTEEIRNNRPLGRDGYALIWNFIEAGGSNMAPRFPKGCVVNMAPVCEKSFLEEGKVYIYTYIDLETGEWAYQMGRLERIDDNCLWARADSNPAVGLCWPLRDDEREAVWDVYEVTHYVSYPAECAAG